MFRRNIIRLRKEHDMTQEELADKLGIARQSVQKWEAGESTPDLERLGRVAKLFGVGVDDILNGDAVSCVDALKAKKKKLMAIRWIYAAAVLALVGLFVLTIPSKYTMIPFNKFEVPIDQAQDMADSMRNSITKVADYDDDDCEILGEDAYVCTNESGVSTWTTIVDEWDTRGIICEQNDVGGGYHPRESCLIKQTEDPWIATWEWRHPVTVLTNQIAILIFVIATYIAIYALVKYKFGNFVWCITQMIIFGLLFVVGVIRVIYLNVNNIEIHGLGVLDTEFLLPIIGIGLIGMGYPLLSLIFLGRRNLDK